MESVNNVHVFLLTFYLCSLFQQWMHQDFASQSKCNALVTSSAFRCAFKELFFKIYFTKLFSSVKSTVTVFAALIVIIKNLGFPITSKSWKRFSSDFVKYLLFPYSCRYDDDIYRQFKRYFKTLKVNIRYFTSIPKKRVKTVKKEAFSS